jgi:hypothetical protein
VYDGLVIGHLTILCQLYTMFNESLVTTAWRVLDVRMEISSRYGGCLRMYSIGSRRQPKRVILEIGGREETNTTEEDQGSEFGKLFWDKQYPVLKNFKIILNV